MKWTVVGGGEEENMYLDKEKLEGFKEDNKNYYL